MFRLCVWWVVAIAIREKGGSVPSPIRRGLNEVSSQVQRLRSALGKGRGDGMTSGAEASSTLLDNVQNRIESMADPQSSEDVLSVLTARVDRIDAEVSEIKASQINNQAQQDATSGSSSPRDEAPEEEAPPSSSSSTTLVSELSYLKDQVSLDKTDLNVLKRDLSDFEETQDKNFKEFKKSLSSEIESLRDSLDAKLSVGVGQVSVPTDSATTRIASNDAEQDAVFLGKVSNLAATLDSYGFRMDALEVSMKQVSASSTDLIGSLNQDFSGMQKNLMLVGGLAVGGLVLSLVIGYFAILAKKKSMTDDNKESHSDKEDKETVEEEEVEEEGGEEGEGYAGEEYFEEKDR